MGKGRNKQHEGRRDEGVGGKNYRIASFEHRGAAVRCSQSFANRSGPGLAGYLFMIGVRYWSSCFIIEGICQQPVGWVVSNGVTDPLDVVKELTFASNTIVLGVDYSFDEILEVTVGRWRRLLSIDECVGISGSSCDTWKTG